MPRWAKDETLAETIARMTLERARKRKPQSGGFKTKKPRDVKNSARARKILTTIYHHNKIKRNLDSDDNFYKGVNVLARLSRELSDDTRLDKTIAWFCSNIHDQYTPRVFDVVQFRTKFFRLEDAMKRHARRNPVLVISPHARRLFNHMGYQRVTNPRGSYSLYKTAFLNLCEITYSNVAQTFFWIQEEYGIDDGRPDFMDFCITYLNEMEDWACNKYQTDEWWKHINPIDIAFRSKTKRFTNAMRNWGKAVYIEPELINEIIKGVNECVSMK